MEKSINQLQTPLWYGKPKYHYKIFKNNLLYYSCISVMKDQDEVMNTLVERFKGDRIPYKVFCNGTHIKTINGAKKGRKSKYHWSNPS